MLLVPQEFGAVIPKITDATTPRQLAQIFLNKYRQLYLGKQ